MLSAIAWSTPPGTARPPARSTTPAMPHIEPPSAVEVLTVPPLLYQIARAAQPEYWEKRCPAEAAAWARLVCGRKTGKGGRPGLAGKAASQRCAGPVPGGAIGTGIAIYLAADLIDP